jgi:hypothetical protein
MTEAEYHKHRAQLLREICAEIINRLFEDEAACRDMIAAFVVVDGMPEYGTPEWHEIHGIPFVIH